MQLGCMFRLERFSFTSYEHLYVSSIQCTIIIRNVYFIVSLNMAYLAAYSTGYDLQLLCPGT